MVCGWSLASFMILLEAKEHRLRKPILMVSGMLVVFSLWRWHRGNVRVANSCCRACGSTIHPDPVEMHVYCPGCKKYIY